MTDARQTIRKVWDAEDKQKPRPQDGGLGHDELRDRWIEQYPHRAFSGSAWWKYDKGKGYWETLEDTAVEGEIADVLEGSRAEGVKVTGALVGSVLRLAKAKTHQPRSVWDADPDVLVCANGALEISTRTLRDHSPEDYATAGLEFDYDPAADAPVFRAVLDQAVPDAVPLIQEFIGYCLTTDTSLEKSLWFKGPRGSGKSTVIEGIQAMLGPRAGVLGLAEIENSSFALSVIPGKTLLTSTEQPAAYLKSTHVIDALISGEPLNIDRKYKESERYKPLAKLIWAMNEAPRIASTQGGIFRRVLLIEFPKLASTPNPQIKEAIKTEGAGILNFALDGLERLRERGSLEIPESVQAATEGWIQSNDIPATFVEEECIVGPEKEVSSGLLYSRYRMWCQDNGHHPLSNSRMIEEWKRLGFLRVTPKGRKFYRGLELR